MEIKFINYTYNDHIIDLEIYNNTITGLTGKSKESFFELISLKKTGKGLLTINDTKITKDNILSYKKKISIIKKELNVADFIITVKDLMNYIIRTYNLSIKNVEKKIKDSLRIVGLEEECLERKISSLSSSEKKLIQYAVSLLSNPELIIIEEPFRYLDNKNEKKIVMLLQRLKEQFSINIILVSDDSNALYKYTNNIIMTKNDEIIYQGDTYQGYQKVDFLRRNKIEVPEIIEFTYLAKKRKNVKIDYHKDIRDIIKDIYKHV